MPQDHSNDIAEALSAMAAGGDDVQVTPPSPGPDPAPVGSTLPSSAASSNARPRGSGLSQSRVTQKQLDFKRTMIPILLTCGVLLIVGGASAWFEASRVSIAQERWLPAVMIVAGAVLLAVAVMNMLQVRDLLRRQERQIARSRRAFDA